MLVIENQPHFDAVVEFAKRVKLYEGKENGCLKNRLDYLEKFGSKTNSEERTRVVLFEDFAPYSFGFVVERKNAEGAWTRIFQGGLIFHGPHDGGGSGSAPSYSVSLSTTVGWAIHT